MRIAYVMGQFPVMSETFIGNEIRAMRAQGNRVFPIALHRPEAAFQPADDSLAAETFYFSPIPSKAARRYVLRQAIHLPRLLPFALSQTSEPLWPFLAHTAQLAEHIRNLGCEHVHAHFAWGATSYAIGAARLAGQPVSFTCHGSDVYSRPVDLPLKCRTADAVIAVAPALSQHLQELSPGARCQTVYCGVDIDSFKPSEERHDRWLFIGRLIDCKGIDDLLCAWALLPESARPFLDIIGDGPLRRNLPDTAKIRFLGAKDSAWIAKHAPSYRALIAPFRQGTDGSMDTAPMVLKEAMAMSLPIVTTRFQDIPEIVGESALLAEPASAPSLAEAISRLQSMPDESLRRMGNAGRLRVEKLYSLPQQAAQLSELFQSLPKRKCG